LLRAVQAVGISDGAAVILAATASKGAGSHASDEPHAQRYSDAAFHPKTISTQLPNACAGQ
jgi:hypothetical protein